MNLFELAAVLTLNSSGYERGLQDAESMGSSFGSKLKSGLGTAAKVAGAALGAASTAVVGFAKSSVDAGMSFDSSMSQVAATMGTTVDQIQDLRDFAQEMGSKTAFSATQAADALNYMALAGYDADTSMEMLPNVLNLAAAGGMELASASDMITDSQSALGLTLDETSQLVDKMAKASSKSNTSVAQLGEAILTVGGTAKNLAGGTTELSTALGILADNGVKGAEGGTALRNIILSLSAPTDTAADAMESLGLNAFDADGNLRPLNETFGDLDKALSTMTQGEQTQVLNQIFNKVDLKSVNALLANTNERFDELSSHIDDASGAAQAMADTQLDNLAGDITIFQSALEGAQITLSDQLEPTLRKFVQFGSDGISKITDGFKSGGLEGAMDAFGKTLSKGISMVTGMLPDVIKAGSSLLKALIEGLTNNSEQIAKAATSIVTELVSAITTNLPILVEGAVKIISTLANGISESLPTLIPSIVQAVMTIVQTLIDNAPMLLEAGLKLLEGLAQGILNSIPVIIEALPEVINGIVDFLIEAIPMIINTGVQLLTALVENLDEIINGIITVLPDIINAIVGALVKLAPQIILAGVDLLVALVKDIPAIISGLVGALPQIIDGLVEGIISCLPEIIEAGVQLIVGLVQNIPAIVAGLVSAVPKIIQGLVEGFSSHGQALVDVGTNLISGVWEGVQNAGTWLKDKVGGFFGGIVDSVKDMLGIHSPSTVFAGIGENMALGLGVGWDDEFSDVQKDINNGLDFSADTSMNIKRFVSTDYNSNAFQGGYTTQKATGLSAAKQPLVVVVQLANGIELARTLIDDINNANRVDGKPKSVAY